MEINRQSITRAKRKLLLCEHLGPAIKAHGQCTINPANRDPFDTLVQSIISQQLSVKAAETIETRVRTFVGDPFEPNNLLTKTHQSLRDCGLSNRKVEYIQGIAKAVTTGDLDFAQLRKANHDQTVETLTALRGVGQWTAEMFMIFSLGKIDIFSVQDVGLQRAMQMLFGETAKDVKALPQLAERWRPYRSIACWYLWEMVD